MHLKTFFELVSVEQLDLPQEKTDFSNEIVLLTIIFILKQNTRDDEG